MLLLVETLIERVVIAINLLFRVPCSRDLQFINHSLWFICDSGALGPISLNLLNIVVKLSILVYIHLLKVLVKSQ